MAVLVLTHQKMTPHTLLLQKRFKNTQRAKAVYDFQSTGVCDSLEVIPSPLAGWLISQTTMDVLV
jgi:hypothetical protein